MAHTNHSNQNAESYGVPAARQSSSLPSNAFFYQAAQNPGYGASIQRQDCESYQNGSSMNATSLFPRDFSLPNNCLDLGFVDCGSPLQYESREPITSSPTSNLLKPDSFHSGPSTSNHRIATWFKNPEVPWHAIGSFSVPADFGESCASEYDIHSPNYVSGPGSGSDVTGYYTDSAYYSADLPAYATGSECFDFSQSLIPVDQQMSDTGTIAMTNIESEDTPTEILESPQGDMYATKPSRGGKRTCAVCKVTLNCPSDWKKHMLKHEKTHRCDVPGCNRKHGFGTVNDLNRHKKSVHKMGLRTVTKSFKCAAAGCKNREKIWPRLDNFKQHIDRMHKNEDMDRLIECSRLHSDDGDAMSLDTIFNEIGVADNSVSATAVSSEDMDIAPAQPWNSIAGNLALPQSNRQFRGGAPIFEQPLVTLANAADLERARHTTSRPLGQASPSFVPLSSCQTLETRDPNVFSKTLNHVDAVLTQGLAQAKGLSILPEDAHAMKEAKALIHDTRGGRFACPKPECSKVFSQRCKLNKHLPRHTRPWLCTAPKCTSRFGTKYDWKRHENACKSLASELSRFYCHWVDAYSGERCKFVHENVHRIRQHLYESHAVIDQDIMNRILSEYTRGQPPRGWCGFCKKFVKWNKNAKSKIEPEFLQCEPRDYEHNYEHRHEHIANHVDRGKCSLEDWTHLETGLRKEEYDPSNLGDWYIEPGTDSDSMSVTVSRLSMSHDAQSNIIISGDIARENGANHGLLPMQRDRWNCCQCAHGPWSRKFVSQCSNITCRHPRCYRCDGPLEDDPCWANGPWDSRSEARLDGC